LSPTAEGAHDWKMGITHMIDGYAGHEHALVVYPLYRDVITLAAASGITYTPTLVVTGVPEGKTYFFTHHDVLSDKKLLHFSIKGDLQFRASQAESDDRSRYSCQEVASSA